VERESNQREKNMDMTWRKVKLKLRVYTSESSLLLLILMRFNSDSSILFPWKKSISKATSKIFMESKGNGELEIKAGGI